MAVFVVATCIPGAIAMAHPLADRCDLFRGSVVADASTASCLRCHGSGLAAPRDNHPIDVDYAGAVVRMQGGMMALRPLQEVVRRGAFLPDGQVRCVTCHDGRSPWRYGLALPPGARVEPAVDPGDRSTYEDGPALQRRRAELASAPQTYDIAVGAKPLCLICHALD